MVGRGGKGGERHSGGVHAEAVEKSATPPDEMSP